MTLTYETAKELKDKGFIQYGKGVSVFSKPATFENIEVGDYAYSPTLEELIGACDTNSYLFAELQRPGSERWEAEAVKIPYKGDSKVGYGDTVAEAVANLWLKINK